MPWQEQIAYYRARAAEYEATSYQDVHGADRRIAALLGRLRPGGDLLENRLRNRDVDPATGRLRRHRHRDRRRPGDDRPGTPAGSPAGNVAFVTTDILTWAPPRLSTPSSSPSGSRTCPPRCSAGSGRCCTTGSPAAASCLLATSPRRRAWRPTWRDRVRWRSGACVTQPATDLPRLSAALKISPASSPSSVGRWPLHHPVIG
jgi:hypothetical protein